MSAAEIILALAGVYMGIGMVAALIIVLAGFGRVDRAANGSTVGFKFLVFPGVVALWPLMVNRWIRATGEPPGEKNAHRCPVETTGGGQP